jgi:hypothetical protein
VRRLSLLSVILAFATLGVSGPISANGGTLQRALIAAACTTTRINVVSKQDGATIYRANCTGSSHRKLIFVCDREMCRSTPTAAPDVE